MLQTVKLLKFGEQEGLESDKLGIHPQFTLKSIFMSFFYNECF